MYIILPLYSAHIFLLQGTTASVENKKGMKNSFYFFVIVIIHLEWNNIIPCGFLEDSRNFVCQSHIKTNKQVAFRKFTRYFHPFIFQIRILSIA